MNLKKIYIYIRVYFTRTRIHRQFIRLYTHKNTVNDENKKKNNNK